jgi:hypothetical protein
MVSVKLIIFNALSEYFEEYNNAVIINLLWTILYILFFFPILYFSVVSGNIIILFMLSFILLIIYNCINYFLLNIISIDDLYYKKIFTYFKLLKKINIKQIFIFSLAKYILFISALLYIFILNTDSFVSILFQIVGFTILFFLILILFYSNVYFFCKTNQLNFKNYLIPFFQHPFKIFFISIIYISLFILALVSVIGLFFFPAFNFYIIRQFVFLDKTTKNF